MAFVLTCLPCDANCSNLFLAGYSVLNACAHLVHLLLDLVSSIVHVGQSLLVLPVLGHVAELCEDDRACADDANAREKVSCLHCGKI